MKKYLTEFDELQAALKQVKINETVMPYHNGHLIYENEDSYAKIQKLLDCPQMSQSHKYLYDLDVENLQECEIDKINQLFDLGVKKGYIDNSFEEEFDREENPTAVIADEPESAECCGELDCCRKAPIACWTVLYSATKNGEIKTGECYSNAINVSAAKADCLAKLARFGYENVSVLAIEAGDPDMCGAGGCCGLEEDDLLKNRPHNAHRDESLAESEVEEDDMLAARPHNGAALHNGHKKVNEVEDADADGDELDEGEPEKNGDEIDEAGKNPYVAGMKVVTGGKASSPAKPKKAKKLKEDDEDADAEDAGDDSDDSAADSDSDGDSADDSEDLADDSDDSEDSDTVEDDSEGDADDSDADDSDADGEDAEDDDSDDSSDEGDDTDEDSEDDSEDSEGDDTDDSDGEDSEEDEDKELTDEEKAQYKDEYKRAFKETMLKCKFEGKSFNDLTIDEKVEFFTKLAEKWTKADPKKFMSDKEEDQLESVTAEK